MTGRKNKLSDLRDHLFATLEDLRDEEKPMDLARAKAICEVSNTIISSAKVEVDMVNAIAGAADPSAFFEQRHDGLLEADVKKALPQHVQRHIAQ